MDSGEMNQNNQPPVTPAPAQNSASAPSTDNTTLMGIFAYLGPLVLIPLLTVKDNAFVRFHTRQGLVLFVCEVIVMIIGMMVYMFWFVLQFVNLALIIFSIIGIINVINKKQEELPFLGQFAKHFNNI